MMIATYSEHYEMIKDYAYAEQTGYTFIRSDADFDSAVNDLKNHVQERNDAVFEYLNQEK